jgi:aspartate aminotransferase-like enzyme
VIEAGKFWVPGPTEVRPEILDAMRRPMIFHRTPEMEALMERSTRRLCAMFGAKRTVHIISASGTAAMELAIRNGSVQKVLSIVHGNFGERFARMAEASGRTVVRLKSALGDAVPIDQVRDALKGGGFDAVTATHNETATGVLSPIAALGQLVNEQQDCLLLVDAVSSAGGTPITADAWCADAVVSASQKALGLPPGLAFAAVSDRLVERAKKVGGRGHYLDLLQYEEFAARHQSPTTPAVSLLFALDQQLADIEVETLDQRYARHRAMAETCVSRIRRLEGAGLGVSLTAKAGLLSPTVSCINVASNKPVLDGMLTRGYTLGGGQSELAKTSFRIGHMGDHSVNGLNTMLDALEEVLRSIR